MPAILRLLYIQPVGGGPTGSWSTWSIECVCESTSGEAVDFSLEAMLEWVGIFRGVVSVCA